MTVYLRPSRQFININHALRSYSSSSSSSISKPSAALRLNQQQPQQPLNRSSYSRQQQRPFSNMSTDYTNIATPAHCYADFCLVPIGTGNPSVADDVADIQRLIKASGLKHTLHSAGTTLEGSWDDVYKVIGQAHTLVHQRGAVRIQTSMRCGTRTDKNQVAEDKVSRVQNLLSEK